MKTALILVIVASGFFVTAAYCWNKVPVIEMVAVRIVPLDALLVGEPQPFQLEVINRSRVDIKVLNLNDC